MLKAKLFRAGIAARRHASPGVVDAVGNLVGNICWALLPGHRRTVMGNLKRLAPGRTPAVYRRLARSTFRHFVRYTADFLWFASLTREQILAMVEPRGFEQLEAAARRGQGSMIVCGHLGSPDIAGLELAALGFPCQTIAESIHPELDDITSRVRSATGLRVSPLASGARDGLRALRRKEVCAVVGDRAIGTPGIPVRFGDGRRPMPRGPATMAIAANAALFVVHSIYHPAKDGPRFLVELHPEIPHDGMTADDVPRLTQVIADHLSAIARQYPDQWLVFQPGWVDDAE